MSPSSAERPLQRFSEDYLERCRDLGPQDIVRFLEDFRRLQGQARARSRLISMRVPEPLLAAFQARAPGGRSLPDADQEADARLAAAAVIA